MKRYLAVLLLATCVLTACLGAFVFHSKFASEQSPYLGVLERHQLAKLAAPRGADTLFVGDSSLGNGIDAAEFDAITGTHSLNLALTGDYGYAGSYNMMQRALQLNPIRTVFIVHTLDILNRKVDYRAHLLTANTLYDPQQPFLRQVDTLRNLALEALDGRSLPDALAALAPVKRQGKPRHSIVNDYHPQDAPLGLKIREDQLATVTINPTINMEQAGYLNRIAALCRERDVTCVYAFGPIYGKEYENSRDVRTRSESLITTAGLVIATDTPYLMDFAELGDNTDHIAPDRKPASTRYYAAALRKYIRPQ